MEMLFRKLLVVGDENSFKKELLLSYTNPNFSEESYVPSVFDNYDVIKDKTGQTINLGLWDTSGQEEYDRLRPISYANTNIILLVFSYTSKTSLQNLTRKWCPEIKHYCRNVPFILVGVKGKEIVDKENANEMKKQALKFALRSGAHGFVECSLYDWASVDQVFNKALDILINYPNTKFNTDCETRKDLTTKFIEAGGEQSTSDILWDWYYWLKRKGIAFL